LVVAPLVLRRMARPRVRLERRGPARPAGPAGRV